MDEIIENISLRYLQGKASTEEQILLFDWLDKDPDHKKKYFEVKLVYDALNCKRPLILEKSKKTWTPEIGWKNLLNKRRVTARRIHKNRVYISWKQILQYAAVVAFTAGITSVAFIWMDHLDSSDRTSTRYIGGNGVKADLMILPDGTKVALSTETSLSYNADYGKKNRVVSLDGQAYFEVVKQKNRPFIVETKGQKIEVLGTKFDVCAYEKDSLIQTTLFEGLVKLVNDCVNHEIVLHPDEQFVYNRLNHSYYIHKVDAKRLISWVNGYYYFHEQTLQRILDSIGNAYNIDIQILSEDLKERIFTGTFYANQSIKEVLDIINISIPIEYKISNNKVIIQEK